MPFSQFDGEADHVHLLVEFRPEISISNLVANPVGATRMLKG